MGRGRQFLAWPVGFRTVSVGLPDVTKTSIRLCDWVTRSSWASFGTSAAKRSGVPRQRLFWPFSFQAANRPALTTASL